MKKIFPLPLLLMLLIILSSCGANDKVGCMDPLAKNYDPDATINGNNCIYPADEFLGQWVVRMNGEYVENGQTYNIPSNYTLIISKTGTNTLHFADLDGCPLFSMDVTGYAVDLDLRPDCNLYDRSHRRDLSKCHKAKEPIYDKWKVDCLQAKIDPSNPIVTGCCSCQGKHET